MFTKLGNLIAVAVLVLIGCAGDMTPGEEDAIDETGTGEVEQASLGLPPPVVVPPGPRYCTNSCSQSLCALNCRQGYINCSYSYPYGPPDTCSNLYSQCLAGCGVCCNP